MNDTKSLMPVKAALLPDDETAAFWAGRIPRRLLAIPFGGPIPSPIHVKGVDLDGETFSERTDIFGNHRALRQTRERLVDFQHSYRPPDPRYGDPTGLMRDHLIGKSILDPDPEEDGWWVDFWVEAGNKRVALIAKLAERAQLFGSSQPIGQTAKSDTGEITLWPFWLETLSTAPQNTYSTIRPLKAALDDMLAEGPSGEFWSGIEAALHNLATDLRSTSAGGEIGAKAGRVFSATNISDLRSALDELQAALDRLTTVVGRQPDYQQREPDQ